jgi:FkbM family methyltransferase
MAMKLTKLRILIERVLLPNATGKLAELQETIRAMKARQDELSGLDHPASLISPHDLMKLGPATVRRRARERVRPIYLGDHRALCTMLARYKFFVDTRDLGFATHLLTDGFWEMGLTEFMVKTVKEGMVVLDVGANFGYYSVLFADLVGPNGRLTAFEPNPHAAHAAEASLSTNGFGGHSRVIRAAVSDSAGSVNFCIPRSEPKNAKILQTGEEAPADSDVTTVPTMSLDEACRDQKVDFIKIDAEGGEYHIFKGMQQLIVRDRPKIVLEFNAGRAFSDELMELIVRHYPVLKYVDSEGRAVEATKAKIMTEHVGEDWMLFLE